MTPAALRRLTDADDRAWTTVTGPD